MINFNLAVLKLILMIRINSISKVFLLPETETVALNRVNLHVKEGEFLAIMGPSGCGKTTLLNILGMIDVPSEGKYLFNDVAIDQLSEKHRSLMRKENIGFVFQNYNLIDELNVWENIELPLLYQKISKSNRKQKVEEILDALKIGHRRNHFPVQLSGGQQQRVAIARAIVGGAKLILADEPTGNLDSVQGDEVMQILTDLNQKGATILMVTHSIHDAEYAQRIIRLYDGMIVSETMNT